MKLSDAVWGVLLMVLGIALLVVVQGFPRIPGQQVGPGLFPGALGAGLAVCGAVLTIREMLARRRAGDAASAWLEWPAWAGSPRHVVAFAVLVAVNLLYLLAVDR